MVVFGLDVKDILALWCPDKRPFFYWYSIFHRYDLCLDNCYSSKKAAIMRNNHFFVVFVSLIIVGCATIADQSRIEEYGQTMDAYETAMRLSDFNAACQFVDPSVMEREVCLKRYDNVKLSNYDVLAMKASQDNREVSQSVKFEYFLLDRHVVKTVEHKQLWRYQEDNQTWLLQTVPPQFK